MKYDVIRNSRILIYALVMVWQKKATIRGCNKCKCYIQGMPFSKTPQYRILQQL